MMKIGLLGHGVIGLGVDRIIKARNDMEVTKVLSLVYDDEIGDRLAAGIDEITGDPEIDTVVEAMGGVHPAFEFVSAAMKQKKNVVTANKALVAACYTELLQLAAENGVAFRCTAAVGGSIPWLVNLERVKRVDTVDEVGGIMNGTTNFIMSSMLSGAQFEDALRTAQELGYAERDPSADIDGLDIRRKLNISVNVAFDVVTSEESIPAFGIRNVTAQDVANAGAMGRTIKLTAFGKNEDGRISAAVEPVMLKNSEPMAAIPSNYNLVYYHGVNAGVQSFIGQGAGRFPTAYNVVQDVVDVLLTHPGFYTGTATPAEIDNTAVMHSYYVRCASADEWLLSVTEKTCDGYVITSPVSVQEMHAWLGSKTAEGVQVFAAAL